MIWMMVTAALIALGTLVMMFDEISTGYYRWRDYIVTSLLLYITGALIFFLGEIVPTFNGTSGILSGLVQLFLGFGVMVMVWGGTLTLGSLIIRLLLHKNPT